MTETYDKTLNIHQRIFAVMQGLSYIQKGQKQVDNQYRYVSHDRVAEVIHAECVKHGFVVIPRVTRSHIEPFRSTSWNKYEKAQVEKDIYLAKVEVCLQFVNIDDPNDSFESCGWPGMGIDPQDKAVGKAVSYAVKYGLLKVFMLETGDDPDQSQNDEYPSKQGAQKTDDKDAEESRLAFIVHFKNNLENCSTDVEVGEIYADSLQKMKELGFTNETRKPIVDACLSRKAALLANITIA